MTAATLTRPRPSTEEAPRHSPAVAYQRVLHQAVRREFRLLAELASWAPADDACRTADLTGHADLLARILLQHHATERELLWPALFRGLPAREQDGARDTLAYWTSRAALLDHMLRDLSTTARQWAVAETIGARNAFARACTRLASTIDAHLAEEERELHPLLARYLTDTEWTAVSRAATTDLTGREQLLLVGLALEDACAIDRARLMAGLAPATRTAWRIVGRRNYRAFVVRLRGAPPAA
ncbi:hemerythrin domain-containing protein [Blastococcus haudaquaticus]|uniref:Hemerythrin HHE cation binding domain-containing protein n=1 Tax=Blastococcus haudaquaticus TaxID=1938745 RepID=A0A286H6Y0_9ACTN|nr:hemerythrin domain-containing protein [Blastococcus haudaquaticus]SOE03543.1 Hemerythrin HHE cation binding domain-containing protein [Blastococcus haudaquaticus]